MATLDGRRLRLIAITSDPIAQCPNPRPAQCDAAANWNIRPRWHSMPHRGCVLR